MNTKKIAAVIAAFLFLYLSLYTWNLRSGRIDALAAYTGLDFVGAVLKPGHWVSEKCRFYWERYFYLIGVEEENDRLERENARLLLESYTLRYRAASAKRLERLLQFAPLQGWTTEGARVIAHRMGPTGLLDTVMIDKGSMHGVEQDMPVVSARGLIGRVNKVGLATSTVLLLTDPACKVAVISRKHRSVGMTTGQGRDEVLKIRYIPLNAAMDAGEVLDTSGLDGIYPPGIPVAVVTEIDRSDIALFLGVTARSVITPRLQEEVLLVRRTSAQDGVVSDNNMTAAGD